MSTQQIIESWENGVEPYRANAHKGTQPERKARYFERQVKKLLGSAYSYGEELYYIGNPLSDHWQTEHERNVISRIERSWNEGISGA